MHLTRNKQRTVALFALVGVLLVSLAGLLGGQLELGNGATAQPNPNAAEQRVEPEVSQLEPLVQGNTAFALDLYDQLAAQAPQANHFVSPLSVSMALAMTWAGARSDTEAAMAETLAFPFEQDRLHAAFNALERQIRKRSNTESEAEQSRQGQPLELNIANALWPQKGLEVRDAFLNTLAAHYGARPVPLDFGAPSQASRTINDWVAKATEDRIDDIVSPRALRRARLVLTNAIYFHAGWLHPFDEASTREATFTALDGSTGTVPMMSQAESFPYARVDGHQLVELPYAGRDTSLIAILPAEGQFESFEAALDAERLEALLSQLSAQQGRVELPRFELKTDYHLNRTLKALGMDVVFEPAANFSGMVEGGGLHIGDVFHDAFVRVDEQGTEAAAATAVVMEVSAPPQGQFELTFDRPFLFLIRDRSTGSVLFLGRVVNVPPAPQPQ
jgi:serpin B